LYLISLIPLNVHIGEVHCSKCHRRSGRGRGKSFLPLAQSGYLLVDPDRAIRVIWFGLAGPITVNGQRYDAAMAPVSLTEQEVADVMNYVLHAWGNQGPLIDTTRVQAAVKAGPIE
jgi:nitrite reductase (NO-forming)